MATPHRSEFVPSAKTRHLPNRSRLLLAERAAELHREGRTVLRLDTMDPAVFDLPAPDTILQDIVATLPSAQGYSEHQGMFAARRAVALYYETVPGFPAVDISDVWLGNGASELMLMSVQALVNVGDEILMPRPSEAIWTSATLLAGGVPRYYDCHESTDWNIDVEQIIAKTTDNTRAVVISNPNNPTGRIYSAATLARLGEFCAERGLVVLSDETLSKVVYRPANFIPTGVYAKDTLCLTFDSLSFGYRAPGYRAGWLVVSGDRRLGREYLDALSLLSELRRSSNTAGQSAVQVALGGVQTISGLTAPGGRLWDQREVAVTAISDLPTTSCYKPDGGLSLFVGIDMSGIDPNYDMGRFAFDLLDSEQVLVEPAHCFAMESLNYFRATFLARERTLNVAVARIGNFLDSLARGQA